MGILSQDSDFIVTMKCRNLGNLLKCEVASQGQLQVLICIINLPAFNSVSCLNPRDSESHKDSLETLVAFRDVEHDE